MLRAKSDALALAVFAPAFVGPAAAAVVVTVVLGIGICMYAK
jgi:hypothetical protein